LKKSYKIILIHVIGVLVLSLLISLMFEMAEAFLIALGAVSVIVATADLFISVILMITGHREWGKMLLLTAGVLYLLGLGICGPMLMFNL
jgi:hypothetical protein